MNYDELIVICTQILAEVLEISPTAVKPEANILSELGGDSIDVLRIAARVEERFGLRLNASELAEVQTMHDMVAGLEVKLYQTRIEMAAT